MININVAFVVLYITFLCRCPINGSIVAKKKIHLAAMIPSLKGDRYSIRTGMELAVELINKDDKYLKDYELQIHYRETNQNALGHAIRELSDLLEKKPVKQVIIGAARSHVSKSLSQFTTFYRIPQVSYSSRMRLNALQETEDGVEWYKDLHDKPAPYYVRIAPSLEQNNMARVKFIQQMKWKRVAILLDAANELLFNIGNEFSRQLRQAGIDIITTQIIRSTPTRSFERIDLNPQLDVLQRTNSRVIVALISTDAAENVFCEAYKRKMFSPNYTWIGTDLWPNNFFVKRKNSAIPINNNCTEDQYREMINGLINFKIFDKRTDSTPIINGFNSAQINIQMLMKRFRNPNIILIYKRPHYLSIYSFDTVLGVAIAIDKLIKQKGEESLLTHYWDKEKAHSITKMIYASDFEGLSGRVHFGNETGADNRLGKRYIKQWYSTKNNSEGKYKDIALFTDGTHQLDIFKRSNDTIFNDGKERKDGSITVNKVLQVTSLSQIIGLWALTGLGVILSIVFFSINVHHRKKRLIKMSSPNVNNGIILGSLVSYMTIILYGLDTRMISKHAVEVTCNLLPVSLSIGFTLTFGCLFSKTWRVYKIFSAVKTMGKVNTTALKDLRLYIVVFLLISIDIVISLAWFLISPFHLEEVVTFSEKVGEDVIDSYFYYKCSCEYELHFNVVVYCYKGFLLAAGLFLAWETRNIQVAALNDSRFIGMAVYNSCVSTIIGVTCFYALTDSTNYIEHGYLIIAIVIFNCTTVTIVFVFAPKIYLLFGRSIHSIVQRARSVQTFSFANSISRKDSIRKRTATHTDSLSSS